MRAAAGAPSAPAAASKRGGPDRRRGGREGPRAHSASCEQRLFTPPAVNRPRGSTCSPGRASRFWCTRPRRMACSGAWSPPPPRTASSWWTRRLASARPPLSPPPLLPLTAPTALTFALTATTDALPAAPPPPRLPSLARPPLPSASQGASKLHLLSTRCAAGHRAHRPRPGRPSARCRAGRRAKSLQALWPALRWLAAPTTRDHRLSTTVYTPHTSVLTVR